VVAVVEELTLVVVAVLVHFIQILVFQFPHLPVLILLQLVVVEMDLEYKAYKD
jgi:hypothetical protein